MMATGTSSEALPREAFHRVLLAQGSRYHVEHPFQKRMIEGRLTRRQLQGWVLNRFYYQSQIPRKDAAILANCDDIEVRRLWVERILEHDGTKDTPGGIEKWLALGEAVGLERTELSSFRHVLPGVRFAVDAYVTFARTAPWQEAVCSSLTELFANRAHTARLEAFPKHYPWIAPDGLRYFRDRLEQTPKDCGLALEITLSHFQTRAQQERALEILKFKLDVLWSLLDAIELGYASEEEPSHEARADRAERSATPFCRPPHSVGADAATSRAFVPGGDGTLERNGGGHSPPL